MEPYPLSNTTDTTQNSWCDMCVHQWAEVYLPSQFDYQANSIELVFDR